MGYGGAEKDELGRPEDEIAPARELELLGYAHELGRPEDEIAPARELELG
jgi:hypothetical protein